MNSLAILRRAPRRAVLALIALALALALPACSAVFRSSIQGAVIDKEAWERDRRSSGVVNASVYLYTDRAAWEEDLAAFVEGSEATLPDAKGKAAYRFFQSTKTDANGAYDFTGFIWESLFPKYGKTADRSEVFLLVYHPDYGLWPNPKPLYVVSEVTNQLGDLAIEDLWNEGRLAGRVLDWKYDDSRGLAGVSVNFYVATSWTYDQAGNFVDPVYPSAPTATTTTNEEGRWAATVRFPMKPNRSAHAAHNKAPVRVAFVRENYRSYNQFIKDEIPDDGKNANKLLITTVDIDQNGRTPEEGDYAEAFLGTVLSYDASKKEFKLTEVAPITMQRWKFSVNVTGRVYDSSIAAPGDNGLNGVKVELHVPDSTGNRYSAYSAQQVIGEITRNGHFNLGTVRWELEVIPAVSTNRKDGRVAADLALYLPAAPSVPDSDPNGGINFLLPDDAIVLELEPTP